MKRRFRFLEPFDAGSHVRLTRTPTTGILHGRLSAGAGSLAARRRRFDATRCAGIGTMLCSPATHL